MGPTFYSIHVILSHINGGLRWSDANLYPGRYQIDEEEYPLRRLTLPHRRAARDKQLLDSGGMSDVRVDIRPSLEQLKHEHHAEAVCPRGVETADSRMGFKPSTHF